MAVVKADGYGHGLVPCARAAVAGGATWLGTALLDEALALRAAGITGRGCWPGCSGRASALADGVARRRRPVGQRGLGARRGRRGRRGLPVDGPGAPQGRHRAQPRRRARPPTGRTWSRRPARPRPTARSRSSASGRTSPTPTRPATRRSAARPRCSGEAVDARRGRRAAPGGAPPGQLGRHPDRARAALRPGPARASRSTASRRCPTSAARPTSGCARR